MNHVTNAIIQRAIDELPNEFDSHDFLRKLMLIAPHAYVCELHEKLHTDDPILQAHSDIASQLNHFDSLEKVRRIRGMNIRGQETENQLWQKRP
jgi:hypothetical protein